MYSIYKYKANHSFSLRSCKTEMQEFNIFLLHILARLNIFFSVMNYGILSKLFKCSKIESELQATPTVSPLIHFLFQSGASCLAVLTLKLWHRMKCSFATSHN